MIERTNHAEFESVFSRLEQPQSDYLELQLVAIVGDGRHGTGFGKTSAANAFAERTAHMGYYARRIDADDWTDRLRRECYQPDEWGGTISVESFIRRWTEKPTVLVIDEIDKLRATEDATANLVRLVRNRHSRLDRATVLATNWTLEELGHLLGPSVLDRVTYTVVCDWPSWRQKAVAARRATRIDSSSLDAPRGGRKTDAAGGR